MLKIELSAIEKRFSGRNWILSIPDLVIDFGERFSLVGPTGSGKSTILRMIAGLDVPDRGEIRLEERSRSGLRGSRPAVGMVFQNHVLFPHLTVRENIDVGRKARRLDSGEFASEEFLKSTDLPMDCPSADSNVELEKLIRDFDLTDLQLRKPFKLSGGERQRVALLQSLAWDPAAFLFDEPFSSIDRELREKVLWRVIESLERRKRTALLVSHDVADAIRFGNRIGVLLDGELLQAGTFEELNSSPNHWYVAKLLSAPPINLVPAVFIVEEGLSRLVVGDQTFVVPQDFVREQLDVEDTGKFDILLGIRADGLKIEKNLVDAVRGVDRADASPSFVWRGIVQRTWRESQGYFSHVAWASNCQSDARQMGLDGAKSEPTSSPRGAAKESDLLTVLTPISLQAGFAGKFELAWRDLLFFERGSGKTMMKAGRT